MNMKITKTALLISAIFIAAGFFISGNVAKAAPVPGVLNYIIKNSLTNTTVTKQLTATGDIYNAGDVSQIYSLEELRVVVTGFTSTPSITSATLNGMSGMVNFTYDSGNNEWKTTTAAGHLFSAFPYQAGINTLVATFTDGTDSITLTLQVNIVHPTAGALNYTIKNSLTNALTTKSLTADSNNIYDAGDVSAIYSLEELKVIVTGFSGTPSITSATLP